MAVQGETIEARIKVNAEQALATLEQYDAKMRAAAASEREADAAAKQFERSLLDQYSAVRNIDAQIVKYERDMHALSLAIASGGKNVQAYKEELRRLERGMDAIHGASGKTATTIRAVSSVASGASTGTRNVGMAALEASRAFEDLQYGIFGVINNIPGMVMALGGSAGLTAAISAAAVGVYQLIKAFSDVEPAVDNAVNESKKKLQSLDDKIDSIRLNIREMEIGTAEAEFEEANRVYVESVEKAREATRAWGGDIERFKRQAAVGVSPVHLLPGELEKAKEAVALADKNYALLLALGDQYILSQNKNKEEGAEKSNKIQKKADDASLNELIAYHEKWSEIEAKAIEQQERMAEEMATARAKSRQMSLVGVAPSLAGTPGGGIEQLDLDAARSAQMAQDWSYAWIVAGNEVADAMGGASGKILQTVEIATAGISQLTEDVIAGQEHAAERFAVLVMQQAGQALVSEGTALAGKAIGTALSGNPALLPLAGAQAAGAAGLISSGVALGGAAAGVSHLVAGGKIGSPLPDKSARGDRGASPRGGASGRGEGLTINIAYGVSGPLPEDTAREIAKAMKTGDRRRGAA